MSYSPPIPRLSLLGAYVANNTQVVPWTFARQRFTALLNNLQPTPNQLLDGLTKQQGITVCLNRAYWDNGSDTMNRLVAGSWGKRTWNRPPRDIDLLFCLPHEVYYRYEQRTGNRQSQLLQEVKGVLTSTYSRTEMRGDGQVVVVTFDSVKVEVVPAFLRNDGKVLICDTNGGGSYRLNDPFAEIVTLNDSDARWGGHTRALVRMMKQWQRENHVPIKSFHIERLAIDFLNGWRSQAWDVLWYDWMVRDFLGYIISRRNTNVIMPGVNEWCYLGDAWESKARTAYWNAVEACEFERDNMDSLAGTAWQRIFGSAIPWRVLA